MAQLDQQHGDRTHRGTHGLAQQAQHKDAMGGGVQEAADTSHGTMDIETGCEIEMSQAAGGGFDTIEMSQAAPSRPPAALFALVGDPAGAHVPATFSLPAQDGSKRVLGRFVQGLDAQPADVALTTRVDLGVSRTNGSLTFVPGRGVVLTRLGREGFPTFLNGALLTDASATLAHGDTIGFGGTDAAVPTAATVSFTADLSALGALGKPEAARMPPPPPRSGCGVRHCSRARTRRRRWTMAIL